VTRPKTHPCHDPAHGKPQPWLLTAWLQKTGLILVDMIQGNRRFVDQQNTPSAPSLEILLHILGRGENEAISLADRLVRCGSAAADQPLPADRRQADP